MVTVRVGWVGLGGGALCMKRVIHRLMEAGCHQCMHEIPILAYRCCPMKRMYIFCGRGFAPPDQRAWTAYLLKVAVPPDCIIMPLSNSQARSWRRFHGKKVRLRRIYCQHNRPLSPRLQIKLNPFAIVGPDSVLQPVVVDSWLLVRRP